jgi:glycine/D-amino acid oxidase-like deaminating enzyme
MDARVFHADFKAEPYWWEAWRPTREPDSDLPARTDVAIIGGGYAGLNAALELVRNGTEVTVFEAQDLGYGASTRSGGAVSGGVSLGKGFSGRRWNGGEDLAHAMLGEAAASFTHVEDLIAREKINCAWEKHGRFVGAWTPRHYADLERKLSSLNTHAQADARMVPRERQREEIASDYYFGGMIVERSAKLHPALYYGGLLEVCRRTDIVFCPRTPVQKVDGQRGAFEIVTSRGTVSAKEVIVATNGYTGDPTPALKRRVVPVASHIIATEELPEDLARSLIPKGRTINDTKRVLCYYRMSPDGRRVVFGGRARFTQVGPEVSAPILHRYMTDRFPQLKDVKVTHAWTGNVAFSLDFLPHMGEFGGLHYCLGCNGSGVAMMSYLGHQTARRLLGTNRPCAFGVVPMPEHALYRGTPWFLPMVGGWYRMRDSVDRMLVR